MASFEIDGHLPGSMGVVGVARNPTPTPVRPPGARPFGSPRQSPRVKPLPMDVYTGSGSITKLGNLSSSMSPRHPPLPRGEPIWGTGRQQPPPMWGLLSHNVEGGWEPFASPFPSQRRKPTLRPLVPGTLPQPPPKWSTSNTPELTDSLLAASFRHPAAMGRPMSVRAPSPRPDPAFPSPDASPLGQRLMPMREHVSSSGFSSAPFVSLR